MSDDALDSRLDGIERRQKYVLALLAYPYLLGATLLLTGDVGPDALLVAFLPAVGIVAVTYLAALVRARTS